MIQRLVHEVRLKSTYLGIRQQRSASELSVEQSTGSSLRRRRRKERQIKNLHLCEGFLANVMELLRRGMSSVTDLIDLLVYEGNIVIMSVVIIANL